MTSREVPIILVTYINHT